MAHHFHSSKIQFKEDTIDKNSESKDNLDITNFQKISIIGDGNCLFRALSYVTFNTEEFHYIIRYDIAKYIVDNWQETSEYVEAVHSITRSEEYFQKMANPRSVYNRAALYGTEYEINIFVKLYNKSICIIKKYDEDPDEIYYKKLFVYFGPSDLKLNYLLHSGDPTKNLCHYEVLLEKENQPNGNLQVVNHMMYSEVIEKPSVMKGIDINNEFPVMSANEPNTSRKIPVLKLRSTDTENNQQRNTPMISVIKPIEKVITSNGDPKTYKNNLNSGGFDNSTKHSGNKRKNPSVLKGINLNNEFDMKRENKPNITHIIPTLKLRNYSTQTGNKPQQNSRMVSIVKPSGKVYIANGDPVACKNILNSGDNSANHSLMGGKIGGKTTRTAPILKHRSNSTIKENTQQRNSHMISILKPIKKNIIPNEQAVTYKYNSMKTLNLNLNGSNNSSVNHSTSESKIEKVMEYSQTKPIREGGKKYQLCTNDYEDENSLHKRSRSHIQSANSDSSVVLSHCVDSSRNIVQYGTESSSSILYIEILQNLITQISSIKFLSLSQLLGRDKIDPLPENQSQIQILLLPPLGNQNGYAVCTFYNVQSLVIYDCSLHICNYEKFKETLRQMYPHYCESRQISYLNAQCDHNIGDNIYFAISVCVSLYYGFKPELMLFNIDELKEHWKKIIHTKVLSPFPFEFTDYAIAGFVSRYNFDRNIITNNLRLNDFHISYFHDLSKYYTLYSPRNTCYLQRLNNITPSSKEKKHIQILFSNSSEHWVSYYYDTHIIYIYDSLNLKSLNEDFKAFLQCLHPYYFAQEKRIYFPRVQCQKNSIDCGIFAIAFTVCLLFGRNPQYRLFDESVMREHLLDMFETKILKPFPHITIRSVDGHLDLSQSSTQSFDLSINSNISQTSIGNLDEKKDSINHGTAILRKKYSSSVNKERCLKYYYKNRIKILENQKKRRSEVKAVLDNDFLMKNKEIYTRDIEKLLGEENASSDNPDSKFDCRMEAEKLINWCFHIRKLDMGKAKNVLTQCKKKIEICFTRITNVSKGNIRNYIDTFCGESKHTSYTEPYYSETVYKACNIVPPLKTFEPAILYLEYADDIEKKRYYTWECNSLCNKSNAYVINRLDDLFRDIFSCTFDGMCQILNTNICMMNKSPDKIGHSSLCFENPRICNAKLLPLDILCPHYPDLRRVRRLLYQLKSLVDRTIKIQVAFESRDFKSLQSITAKMKEKISFFPDNNDSTIVTDDDIITRLYRNAFMSFTKRMQDLPLYSCCSCERVCYMYQLKPAMNYDERLTHLREWNDLKQYFYDDIQNLFICNHCLTEFQSKDKCIPSFCILNSLAPGAVPGVISCLNPTEKLLIQRAKAFQVIQYKGAVMRKNLPNKAKMRMLVGRTFHLNLPLQETLTKICPETDPINKNLEMYILVRGIPNKSKVVFESLVDVNKVFLALQWLKINNPLYYKIELPKSPECLQEILNDLDTPEVQQQKLSDGENIETDVINNNKVDDMTECKKSQNVCQELKTSVQKLMDIDTGHEALLTCTTEKDQFYENYSIQPIYERRVNKTATALYQQVKVHDVPLYRNEENLDLMCFPDLFPYGINGQFEPRNQRLRECDFIKLKLTSKDPRYRRNSQYIFHLLNDCNQRQLNGGIYQTLHITNPKEKYTKRSYLDKLLKDELEPEMQNVFSRLRNTKQFWKKPTCELLAMVNEYGPATWFLTLSSNEWDEAALIQYIRDRNPDIDTSKMSVNEIIAFDPVSVARYMDTKFDAILKFITSEDEPIGEVVHYFWHREYQQRGMVHFHLMIWVKGAPRLGKDPDSEIAEFIQKYVTCNKPDEKRFPLRYQLVNNYQTHKHNDYCLRSKKTKNATKKVCRFGFPRPVTDDFVLRNVQKSIAGRRNLKSKSRLYDLPRKKEEELINDYNLPLILAWKTNIDLQYIGDEYAALARYIVKYILKSEKSGQDNIFEPISSTKSLCSRLWSFANQMLNNREIGELEAVETCLGFSLYGHDPETIFKWIDVKMIRNKRIKPKKVLENLEDDCSDIFFDDIVDVYYRKRPKDLENWNLYDFAAWFEAQNDEPKMPIEYYPLENGKFLKRRLRRYIIHHYMYKVDVDPEKFYYSLLLLKKPWRDTDELKGNFASYTESFSHWQEKIPELRTYYEKLTGIQLDMEKINQLIEEEMEKEKENHDQSDDQNNVECVPHDDNAKDIMNHFKQMTEKNKEQNFDWRSAVASMNTDQKRIFNHVMDCIRDGKKICRRFITGEAGTGKSFIIKCLIHAVEEQFHKKVVVVAPTGLAAFNVNGFTIHNLFQIGVPKKDDLKYTQLSDSALKIMRQEFADVALVIIDEISMVSNLLLLYIHLRSTEIFNTYDSNEWFGGKHLLCFGDLLQLRPVKQNPVFIEITKKELSKFTESIDAFNLWEELFDYDELRINMRQQNDNQYKNILQNLRLGIINENDTKILRSRIHHFKTQKLADRTNEICEFISTLPEDTICILPKSDMCNAVNAVMLNRINSDQIILDALDDVLEGSKNEKKAILKAVSDDETVFKTAGLLKNLKIKIGARVMIRKNIDLSIGIVNGTICRVRNIIKSIHSESEIEKIELELPTGQIYQIERVPVLFEFRGLFVKRMQFPLILSWAITIHKSQGLSLQRAVIDAGETNFTCGQIYVALSRLVSLDGLYLINYDPHNVKADMDAIREYNRLRHKYRPDLALYQLHIPRAKKIYDQKWVVQKDVLDIQSGAAGVNNKTWDFKVIKCDEFSSYVNVTVYCLFNSVLLRQKISNFPQSNILKSLLNNYVSGNVKDSLELKLFVGNEYITDTRSDVVIFMNKLIHKIDGLKNITMVKLTTIKQCQNCPMNPDGETIDEDLSILNLDLPNTGKLYNLTELIKYNMTPSSKMEKCKYCLRFSEHIIQRTLKMTSKVLMINFSSNSRRNEKSGCIKEISNFKGKICNFQYHVSNAIFYKGKYADNDYVCMSKNKDGWHKIDNELIEKRNWPRNSVGVVMIILETK